MWNFWHVFSIEIWLFGTQTTFHSFDGMTMMEMIDTTESMELVGSLEYKKLMELMESMKVIKPIEPMESMFWWKDIIQLMETMDLTGWNGYDGTGSFLD